MTAAALQALRAAEEEAEEHESRKSLHIAKLGEPFVVQKKGALLGAAAGSTTMSSSGSSKGGGGGASSSRKSIIGGRGFVRVGVPRAGAESSADSAKGLQYDLESLPDDDGDDDDDRSLESLLDDSGDQLEQDRSFERPAPKPVVTRPISMSRPLSTSRLLPINHANETVLTERSRDALKSSKEVSM